MNNKGADQNARMGRLVCTFVVRKLPKTGFLESMPKCCFLKLLDIVNMPQEATLYVFYSSVCKCILFFIMHMLYFLCNEKIGPCLTVFNWHINHIP